MPAETGVASSCAACAGCWWLFEGGGEAGVACFSSRSSASSAASSSVRNGGGMTPSERQLAARDRFDGAMAEAGAGLKDILWRVACAGEGVPAAEKALAWPVRSGKLVLSLALDRVAQFYRIA